MDFKSAAAGEHDGREHRLQLNENVRGAIVVVVGAAALIGIAFGAMALLTSPDGWVMKAANQAMTTAQQGTLASYSVADAQ
jgi:hypothetical protein